MLYKYKTIMGLFDKVFKKEVKIDNEAEAYLTVLLLCSSTDGDIGAFEVDVISKSIIFKKIFQGINTGNLIKECFENAKAYKKNPNELIDLCIPHISNNEALFTHCVDLVLSDGSVGPEEEEFISNLASKLKISQERSQTIVDVLMLKIQ